MRVDSNRSFSELNEDFSAAYINMIRDPIDRFESFYYFSRFGNEKGGGGNARLSDEQRNESVDECVAKRRRECTQPVWQVVPYFCGMDAECNNRHIRAVQIAKVSRPNQSLVLTLAGKVTN